MIFRAGLIFLAGLPTLTPAAQAAVTHSGTVRLEQLQFDYNRAPVRTAEFKPVVGHCDGKPFTDEAAYQGCLRNYQELHNSLPSIPNPDKDDGYRRMIRTFTSGAY